MCILWTDWNYTRRKELLWVLRVFGASVQICVRFFLPSLLSPISSDCTHIYYIFFGKRFTSAIFYICSISTSRARAYTFICHHIYGYREGEREMRCSIIDSIVSAFNWKLWKINIAKKTTKKSNIDDNESTGEEKRLSTSGHRAEQAIDRANISGNDHNYSPYIAYCSFQPSVFSYPLFNSSLNCYFFI